MHTNIIRIVIIGNYGSWDFNHGFSVKHQMYARVICSYNEIITWERVVCLIYTPEP